MLYPGPNKMNHSITIIGYGRLGQTLERACIKAGFDVAYIYKNKEELHKMKQISDLVFITPPDSEIAAVCEYLRFRFYELVGKTIAHCSGVLPSDILLDLKEKGASIACFHPMQSVTLKTKSFKGITFDIEGDDKALRVLEDFASKINANSLRVSSKQKEMLHVSAVMASNYLVTLADLSSEISEESGLSPREVLDALLPLMNSTIENLKEMEPSDALTGPIARGDVDTVERHVKFLKNRDKLLSIYKKMGLLTLELVDPNVVSRDTRNKLYEILR